MCMTQIRAGGFLVRLAHVVLALSVLLALARTYIDEVVSIWHSITHTHTQGLSIRSSAPSPPHTMLEHV